jgi:hypothetical protein
MIGPATLDAAALTAGEADLEAQIETAAIAALLGVPSSEVTSISVSGRSDAPYIAVRLGYGAPETTHHFVYATRVSSELDAFVPAPGGAAVDYVQKYRADGLPGIFVWEFTAVGDDPADVTTTALTYTDDA